MRSLCFLALGFQAFVSLGTTMTTSQFTHPDVAIPKAPEANQLPVGRQHVPGFSNLRARQFEVLNHDFSSSQSDLKEDYSPSQINDRNTEDRFPQHDNGGKKRRFGDAKIGTIRSGQYPIVNVTWGNKSGANGKPQHMIAILDTGSSDTWGLINNFTCRSLATDQPAEQSACGFTPSLDLEKIAFENITDERLWLDYQGGGTVNGSFGYAPITVGGITVPKQQVGLGESVKLTGEGHTSGLLGLGYPGLTKAYSRTKPYRYLYDPWFTTAVKDKRVDQAVFTIAMNRVPPGGGIWSDAGTIAFGGLVAESYYEKPFTSVPHEQVSTLPANDTDLMWYITSAELVYQLKNGSRVSSGKEQYLLDTGTAFNGVKTADAAAINSLYDPPAVWDEEASGWSVACDAKVPYVAYIIGGVEMPMHRKDMLSPSYFGNDNNPNKCFTAFTELNNGQPGTNGYMGVLGGAFHHGYVVAYDVGRKMSHFAKRRPY